MKQKFIILSLALVTIFNSCKKEHLTNGLNTSQRSAGDKDLDLLGYGYDATGNYADEMFGKGMVVDVKKIRSENRKRIEEGEISRQDFSENSAEDSRTYISNILKNINIDTKLLLFSSTLRSKFLNYDSTDTKYSYASVDKLIIRKKLTINMLPEEIKKSSLSSNFVEDCEIMTPQEIIKHYGTHVLMDITLGGKINVTYRSEINSTDKRNKVDIGAKAGTFKVFGLGMSASGGINIDENELRENKNQSLVYSAIGGDPSINIAGTTNLTPGNIQNRELDLTKWQNSVTLDNSHLIDIGKDGLLPIYELIPGHKAVVVKEYFLKNLQKLKKVLDYQNVGDIVYYKRNSRLDETEIQYDYLLMNMPDGFKIVSFTNVVNGARDNTSIPVQQLFPKTNLFGDRNVDCYEKNDNSIRAYDELFTRTQGKNAFANLRTNLEQSGVLATMKAYTPTSSSRKDWSVDLVQLTSTNQYFVRYSQYTKTQANATETRSDIFYPIAKNDIARYGFNIQNVKQIASTGSSLISKSF